MKFPTKYKLLDDVDGAMYSIPFESKSLKVMASSGCGWEHVSVSLNNRCPNWREMCFIKNLFWEPEEAVMQIHPPLKKYVNNHPYCLHLWKPIDQEIPLPPSILVGIL